MCLVMLEGIAGALAPLLDTPARMVSHTRGAHDKVSRSPSVLYHLEDARAATETPQRAFLIYFRSSQQWPSQGLVSSTYE